MNLFRLFKWKYSPSLLLAGANTLCTVIFQLGVLSKLGVGSRSDLYFAAIVTPMVLYTLAFGALSNILIPMFVETWSSSGKENTLLWNGLFAVFAGGLLLLAVSYYPILYLFPVMFLKLKWVDLGQVGNVLLAYSAYQTLFSGLTVKNCFLLAEGRPVATQAGVFCGWFVSLLFLAFIQPGEPLWRIPLCLIFGNAVALAYPNLRRQSFSYRRGFFRSHVSSLVSRALPVAVGGSVTKLEPIFDGVIASFFKEGSLTIFYFFGRIMFYITSITYSGYLQPEQKGLAEAVNEGRWDALRRGTRLVSLRAILISVAFLAAIVCTLTFLLLSGFAFVKPYVGYFGQNISVFFLLLGYLLGMLIGVAYANSLYAVRREKLFLFVTLATFPVGILFKLVGAHLFGLGGLAAGTSIYWLSYAAGLATIFVKDISRREAIPAIQPRHLALDQSTGQE